MRISDWSSDVCSSDLADAFGCFTLARLEIADLLLLGQYRVANLSIIGHRRLQAGNISGAVQTVDQRFHSIEAKQFLHEPRQGRSEEHTSELQSLMRISYAVFCLKKQNDTQQSIK